MAKLIKGDRPDKKELRKFGLVAGAITAALFGLLLPWLFDRAIPLWPWIVAGVLWLWGGLLPGSLLPVYRVWMGIGHVLGWINTRIILGVLFYILFLPTGLVMRMVSKDPMARKIDKSEKSYRLESDRPTKNHVERPY